MITWARGDGATETGTVAWVSRSKNNGFVRPDDGGVDLFVESWDAASGVVGSTVEFERRHRGRGHLVAMNVVARTRAAADREAVASGMGSEAGR